MKMIVLLHFHVQTILTIDKFGDRKRCMCESVFRIVFNIILSGN